MLHGRTDGKRFDTVLKVALYADLVALLAIAARLVLPRLPDLPVYLLLCGVFEVQFGEPVDAADVDPAYIGLHDCTA